jgi:hypothetical protein
VRHIKLLGPCLVLVTFWSVCPCCASRCEVRGVGQWLRCVVDLDGCDALLIQACVAHEADSGEI